MHWHVLCTAVHASVQHRISLYTPKSLLRQKVDRGRINGTLRYWWTPAKPMDKLSSKFSFFSSLSYAVDRGDGKVAQHFPPIIF